MALYLLNLPGCKSSSGQYVWRFYVTENYTKTNFICNTPPYSHGHLLASSDCPRSGCSTTIYLNFTKFNNIREPDPLLCFTHDQQGRCSTSSWRNCMGCTWGSCKTHRATANLQHPSVLKIVPQKDTEGNIQGQATAFSLVIRDPWDAKWTSPQKAAVYEVNPLWRPTTYAYPASHLFIWRAYELTSTHKIHSEIQNNEQTLTKQISPEDPTFSWLGLLREGLRLANASGLTNLTSCLMCAALGQTPLMAVPLLSQFNTSTSTPPSPASIPGVPLYHDQNPSFPICYSKHNHSQCNLTISASHPLSAPPGNFFWCNGTLYKNLSSSSTTLCLPVTLVPRLTIYTPAEFILKQVHQPNTFRARRSVFLPVAVGLSLASSAVAAGLAGGALYNTNQGLARLSSHLQAALEDSAESLASLQRQITSIAQVALQNRRALDLLTAERGGTCVFLQEECCYYINESGLVETRIENLQKIKTKLQNQKFSTEATAWWSSSMYTLLAPLLGPLIFICLILLAAPCLCQFLQQRLQQLTQVAIHQMMLTTATASACHPDQIPLASLHSTS